jgi:hypothetical protein
MSSRSRIKKFSEYLNESNQGSGREVWQQLMYRALKDGLLSELHFDNRKIQAIAKELAEEFKRMDEPSRQSNRDLFLKMFYSRIPKWAWGNPTPATMIQYGLGSN